MATIKDVARRAGVSTATVSRVINGNYPVSKQTKEKVEEAIDTLGFHLNAVAKSLKLNKTFLIGMIVPDISNPYFMGMARGIESVIAQEGYSIVFGSTDEDAEKELKLLSAFKEKRYDFIVLATRNTQVESINTMIHQGLKLIMIDTTLDNVAADAVLENDYDATYELMKHLISQGHKNIAIVNGLLTVSTGQQRFQAYKDALKDNNLVYNERWVLAGDYNRERAYQSVTEMLTHEKDEWPTAIFSANNIMTEGALIALQENKLSVPNDMSIVSFGDITVPKLSYDCLTIIEQDSYKMGETTGQLILKRAQSNKKNNEHKEIIVPLGLRIGDSVKKINKL